MSANIVWRAMETREQVVQNGFTFFHELVDYAKREGSFFCIDDAMDKILSSS